MGSFFRFYVGYLMNTGLHHLLQGPERLPTGDIEAIFSLRDSDFTFSMVGSLSCTIHHYHHNHNILASSFRPFSASEIQTSFSYYNELPS
jgi:hypothetical protein